jgi:hypothetical protein
MRAAIAFATESAGLMPKKISAIIMNNHGSFSTILDRQLEAEARPKATKQI